MKRKDGSRAEVIAKYREWVVTQPLGFFSNKPIKPLDYTGAPEPKSGGPIYERGIVKPPRYLTKHRVPRRLRKRVYVASERYSVRFDRILQRRTDG